MEYAIEVNHLIKHYGKFTALNDLSIHVPKGKVYGFLGRNGSGKTTTIRIIMGLVKAEYGNVKICGVDIAKDRRNALQRIGAIVETPGAYENLTAAENLAIIARMHKVSYSRINEVLEIVGLSNITNKKVGQYSLGMRQRLGIANALIHSPNIIILDEPTNGLDPEGIKEMRKIIRSLSEMQGISVLISSHLLSEIEQIADYVGIINEGHLLQEEEISTLQSDAQCYVVLETNKIEETMETLKSMNFHIERERNAIKVFCKKSENGRITVELIKKGITICNLSSTAKTLEERFLAITKDKTSMKEENI